MENKHNKNRIKESFFKLQGWFYNHILNMRVFAYLCLFTALLLAFTSCYRGDIVRGNHHAVQDRRYISGFINVTTNGDFTVNIRQGDEFSVVIYAESNLLQHIETRTAGSTLIIEEEEWVILKNHVPMEVNITMPDLANVILNGSGSTTVSTFNTTDIRAHINGSGHITLDVNTDFLSGQIDGSGRMYLSGFADESTYKINGSGDIDAYNVDHGSCSTSINGSGDIKCYVLNELSVNINGSGTVTYWGSPSIASKVNGSGRIIHR